MERKILYANKGKILTDGKAYGTKVYPADGVEESAFYEITMEEYEAIMAAQQAEVNV